MFINNKVYKNVIYARPYLALLMYILLYKCYYPAYIRTGIYLRKKTQYCYFLTPISTIISLVYTFNIHTFRDVLSNILYYSIYDFSTL